MPCLFVFLVPLGTTHLHAQTISKNENGMHDGFFYSFWIDTPASASMTLLPDGRYTTTWNKVGNFIAGKGWEIGSPDRVIEYSGSFNGGYNGNLALYGWTRNPLVEYYVVENHGVWIPPGGTLKGTFQSDNGTYQLYQISRTAYLSIDGIQDFQTYWSVRTQKRSSGTVTFANHVAAWQAKGMTMGKTWAYQIMATEGYQSTGSSDITVSGGIVTEVHELSLTNSKTIQIYPNHATNTVKVVLPAFASILNLYTLDGTIIWNRRVEGDVVEIDMAEFKIGIYLLKIESGGQACMKKLIVL